MRVDGFEVVTVLLDVGSRDRPTSLTVAPVGEEAEEVVETVEREWRPLLVRSSRVLLKLSGLSGVPWQMDNHGSDGRLCGVCGSAFSYREAIFSSS
jgi:hypothetical protein